MKIYSITNIENYKMYIGSSVDFDNRKREHLNMLRNNKHHSPHLQNSYTKYGEDSFIFEIIADVKNREDLIKTEQYWMDAFESYNPEYGYNMSPTAGSSLGVIRTEESKQLMSSIMTGKEFSEEHKKNISIACKGRKLSEETIAKIVESRKGYRHSDETKQKMSDAHEGRVYSSLSEETKKKLSEVLTGRVISDETKAKMFEAQMGNTKALGFKHTDLTKYKIREAKMGSKNPYYDKGNPVLQYDMDGNFLKEFVNAERAAEAEGIFPQNIGAACKGRYKHSGSFIWKYKEEI